MKVLLTETMAPASSAPDCAAALLMEVAPQVMRWVRQQMRAERMAGLSVPEFRALILMRHAPGLSLNELCQRVGVSVSYGSKIVDRLVERGLAKRDARDGNRRSISLTATAQGRAALDRARRRTEARLAEIISAQPDVKTGALMEVLRTLRDALPATSLDQPLPGERKARLRRDGGGLSSSVRCRKPRQTGRGFDGNS